ncbi:AraC family transcriptional regulator [Alteromonas halophila]|uniref:AraC family transcriptional regulator n=1 Tax=Alteromonas halophila TaxID=516698 RepID=A0A918JQ59_9ALTE|nr:AraC family transcriptional regulator [Alteromonas halophila]GGW93821.1 AraC family transcriptional regulator [Alteromonas halophila]
MTSVVNFQAAAQHVASPDKQDLQALTQLLGKYAPHDGDFSLAGDAVHVVRSSVQHTETHYMLSQPSICIVPQGAKRVALANQTFEYDHSKMVVYAAEVPIHVTITQASVAAPYFCLVIPINPRALNRLVLTVFPHGVPRAEKTRAVYVGDASAPIVSTARRLMDIIHQQQDTDLLVPHTIDEILLRLLRSPVGPAIAQLGVSDSHAEKIANAISWIKTHFTKALSVDDLARRVGMSTSSFHAHFKAVTQLSPLQFQKVLRLQEARELLRSGTTDVTSVAFQVGYASASQFSREYTREFDIAPSKDI